MLFLTTLTPFRITIVLFKLIALFLLSARWLRRTRQMLILFTEFTLFFSQDPICLIFLLKPAPFFKVFAGFNCINKPATYLLFQIIALSLFCFLFHCFSHSLAHMVRTSFLCSCVFKLSRVSGHPFLLGNDAVDKLARRGKRCYSHLQILLVSYLLFWTGSLMYQCFSTQKFPQFALKNLCFLVVLASSCFVCNGHNFLSNAHLFLIVTVVQCLWSN